MTCSKLPTLSFKRQPILHVVVCTSPKEPAWAVRYLRASSPPCTFQKLHALYVQYFANNPQPPARPQTKGVRPPHPPMQPAAPCPRPITFDSRYLCYLSLASLCPPCAHTLLTLSPISLFYLYPCTLLLQSHPPNPELASLPIPPSPELVVGSVRSPVSPSRARRLEL